MNIFQMGNRMCLESVCTCMAAMIRFGAAGFCLNDYVCYSADVHDLSDWKYEGVILRKEQDPRNQNIPEDAPDQPLLFGIEPEKEEDLNLGEYMHSGRRMWCKDWTVVIIYTIVWTFFRRLRWQSVIHRQDNMSF